MKLAQMKPVLDEVIVPAISCVAFGLMLLLVVKAL
jgi:hypothetical protein